VVAVQGAMATYGSGDQTRITVPASATAVEHQRRLWDFNGDRWLDGEPRLDDRFSSADRDLADAAGYTGFVLMGGRTWPTALVDRARRLTDPWGRNLHIAFAATIYGPTGISIWSEGPD
jgi:hypothetical protein